MEYTLEFQPKQEKQNSILLSYFFNIKVHFHKICLKIQMNNNQNYIKTKEIKIIKYYILRMKIFSMLLKAIKKEICKNIQQDLYKIKKQILCYYQIKLVEVDNVFQFEQKQKDEIKIDDGILYQNMTRGEKKQLLVDAFGTKKSKQKLIQANSNIVQESNIAAESEMKELLLQKTGVIKKQIKNEKNEKNQEADMKQEFLPEFDLDAKKADKIFNITSILSTEDFDIIDTTQFTQLYNDQNTLEKSSKFLQPYIFQKLSQKLTSLKIKYLQYLELLLKVNKFNSFIKTIDEISQELGIQIDLLKNICKFKLLQVKKFYVQVPTENKKFKFVKTTSLMDKMICFIIVLALCISDYKMEDGKSLAQNLKLESKKFVSYCKEIGCSLKIDKLNMQIELKAPLQLQKNNKIPPKKG